jgi:hypothetical protein
VSVKTVIFVPLKTRFLVHSCNRRDVSCPLSWILVHLHIQSDYKRCELLHKSIGKKLTDTKKLNTYYCKDEPKTFFFCTNA